MRLPSNKMIGILLSLLYFIFIYIYFLFSLYLAKGCLVGQDFYWSEGCFLTFALAPEETGQRTISSALSKTL